MTVTLILKVSAIWLLIAVFAVGNGLVREQFFIPKAGPTAGLILSGIFLSVIIFAVTFVVFNWFGPQSEITYFGIGLQWVLMTLAFEFLFGHYVGGKSWVDILAVFNIAQGNLFSVALIVTLLSPWLVAKIKSIV